MTDMERRLVAALRDTEDHARLLVQGLDGGRRWEVYERNKALLSEINPTNPFGYRHPRPLRAQRERVPRPWIFGTSNASANTFRWVWA